MASINDDFATINGYFAHILNEKEYGDFVLGNDTDVGDTFLLYALK